ncbi:hypothetical protein TNCT_660401 [Trichonephila clavata]|uniref:Uncharacterized protein n=1 Tax=Trichonephila clavata TaxID=2740835 RepID=A0A8X6G9L5_TRICU|nr:hypothetical protein TNCT_660401 [Trichonephila clavata]
MFSLIVLIYASEKEKNISTSTEHTTSVVDANCSPTFNDQETAEALGHHSTDESKLVFNREDKNIGRQTRNLVKSCHFSANNQLFNDPITSSELLCAIRQLNPKKSPGPDDIHGQFLANIEQHAQESVLHIFNLSWREKNISTQPEHTNSIVDANSSPTVNDQMIAEALGHYYTDESKLVFNREDKKIGRQTRNLIKSRHWPANNQLFNDPITSS